MYFIQDRKRYTGVIYENKTASVLTLKGNANELGTYECRWNNSKGEARHKQFTVSLSFVEDKSDIIILSATVIGFLLIGMGIAIKVYLDKVKNQFLKKSFSIFQEKVFTVALPALGVVFLCVVIFIYLNSRPKNIVD